MILFVCLEHEKVMHDMGRKAAWLARRLDAQYRFEEISGHTCMVQRYTWVTRRRLKEWGVRAILFSGCSTDWDEYAPGSFDEIQEIIRAGELPMLGFCGGHQMIAMAHGAPLGPLRRLAAGEKDPGAVYASGYLKEWGFTSVRVVREDPLFAGLPAEPIFLESHYWEVKELPAGFELLASTEACRIQAFRQVGRPIYGVQFHPEEHTLKPYDDSSMAVLDKYPGGYAEARPDGRTLMRNFFKVAGIV